MKYLSKIKSLSKQHQLQQQQHQIFCKQLPKEGQIAAATKSLYSESNTPELKCYHLWLIRQLSSYYTNQKNNINQGKKKGNSYNPTTTTHPHNWRITGILQPSISGAKSGMVSKAVVVLMVGLVGMAYQATQDPPPPQAEMESSGGEDAPPPPPPSRARLADGRYLAYVEKGVPKNKAKHKIIIVHGFGSSKEMNFLAPQELIDELGIYMLHFDRAGYGESDPNPRRTVKSEATDIEELADHLVLGSKFYVIGVSLGSYPIWSCLKHIPDRLAGAALIVPVVNYRWPSLPKRLIQDDYRRKLVQLSLWFSKHAPGIMHWWVTQKWLPSSSVLEKNPVFFNPNDIEILKKIPGFPMLSQEKLKEREIFDTLRNDFMVGFGNWDFDPTDLADPFKQDESNVHIFHGLEDRVVPVELQRFISGKLPWIRYHEVPGGGHLIVHYNGLCEAVLRALLLGEEPVTLDQVHP